MCVCVCADLLDVCVLLCYVCVLYGTRVRSAYYIVCVCCPAMCVRVCAALLCVCALWYMCALCPCKCVCVCVCACVCLCAAPLVTCVHGYDQESLRVDGWV